MSRMPVCLTMLVEVHVFVHVPVISYQDGWTLGRGIFPGPEAACYLRQGDVERPRRVALPAQTNKKR